jgi:small subunit ribosomal protein S4
MGRYLDAKCRLCRREGMKLFLKGDRCLSQKCPIEKKGAVPPGTHGLGRRRRRPSEYGAQLREKQKAKRLYGVREKQFKKYFDRARKEKQATGEALFQILEFRLDNVVYRLGLAPSRTAARQLISHGHIQVGGKKVDIPSYEVKLGETIGLSPQGAKIGLVKDYLERKDIKIPVWLERKATVGKVKRLPKRDEIEANVNEQAIVEFYSR